MSHYGTADGVKELLAAGANVDCRDRDGSTPLMFAVNMRMILQQFSLKLVPTSNYAITMATALDMARRNNNVEMISLLTKAARRQEATMLLNWMLAMAPLELPICEYRVTRIVC